MTVVQENGVGKDSNKATRGYVPGRVAFFETLLLSRHILRQKSVKKHSYVI